MIRSTVSSSSPWPRPARSGHWKIVQQLNERAGNAEVGELAEWAIPIQERHFDAVLAGSLELAVAEDPNEIAE
jgi:hypothetical protein